MNHDEEVQHNGTVSWPAADVDVRRALSVLVSVHRPPISAPATLTQTYSYCHPY